MTDRWPRPLAAPQTLALVAATLVLLAGCGASETPSGSLATPVETSSAAASPAPGATESPPTATEPPSPSANPSPSGDPDAPTAEAFWATVRRGLDEAGHLVVTATGDAPVVVRFRPDASEALVAGDLVSRCVGTRSWAGGEGSLAPVPGLWRCGADALVAGFRATAAPIDSWSPDFPVEGSPGESIAVSAAGPWTWSYALEDGMDGPLEATLTLDPATGRLIEGRRTDAAGTTTWTFDYETVVDPIAAP